MFDLTPILSGNLLDNPRCADQFRDDVIERVHHKTMPIYIDVRGNIKIYFYGNADTCNIFMEDPSIEIPMKTLYKYKSVRTAIVSKVGAQGFQRIVISQINCTRMERTPG